MWLCVLMIGELFWAALSSPAVAAPPVEQKPAGSAQAQPGLRPDAAFTRITTEQGLSDLRVVAIMQDHAGFMWFGTTGGLDRYDGYDVVAYRNDPTNPHSLSGNFIDALYEGRDGTLWVGTRSGLNAFDRRTERFTRYLHDPADPRSLGENTVLAIYEDRSGVLWIGTDGGLNRFDRTTGTFTAYRHDPANPRSLSDDTVRAIYEDRAGVLWIGTDGGLNRFDRASGSFTAYRHDAANPQSLSNDSIWDIYEDRTGTLWMTTDGGGLNRFDRATTTFTQYRHDPKDPHSLSTDRLDCIFEDAAGALWVGTFNGGLSVLDPARRTFSVYRHERTNPGSLSNDSITDIIADRSGLIWMGSAGGGVNIYNPKQQAFANYRRDSNATNTLASDRISAVYEDRDGVLWVGMQDRGLDRFDRRSGQVVHYPPDSENPQRLGHPFVSAIQQDQSGALWVGTYGGGLYRLDVASDAFTAYRHEAANPQSLSDDTITALRIDRSGALWIATSFGGLDRLDPASGSFTAYRHEAANPQSLSSDSVWAIDEDQRGNIWVGTLGGGLNRLDPVTGQVTRYQHDPQNPASLNDDNIYDIHFDRSGVLWVGMFGGGLDRFDPARGTFTHYRERDGLASDRIVSILEDGDGGARAAGNLWVVTGRGLSKLDQARKTFHKYGTTDGLPLTEYLRGHYKTRNGELLIGSTDGLIAFDPAAVQDDAYVPPVVFTDFQLANKPVPIGDDSPLKQAIDQSNTIELTYAERVVSFEFAALSYRAPHQNRYRYKLEGFDPDWTEVDATRRLITYTNLDPGTYVFRVTGSNGAGVWNEAGRAITLIVTPPWWATWWFRILALALVIGAVVAGYVWRVNNLQAQQRRLEALVAERTNELEAAKNQAESANRAKSTFLATMSHELRTPLNAILGFAQILARSRDLSPQQRQSAATIQRSGEHLLALINNVLDLSKVEAERMTLNQVSVELDQLLDQLETMFQRRAAEKGLRLRFEPAADLPRAIHADATKLRQVLINLLGNAIKFTQAGEVTLRVSTDERPPTIDDATTPPAIDHPPSSIVFEVADTGPGVPPEEQERIFEAFAQAAAGSHSRDGTGLGLAISRRFVQLMGGTLSVRSELGRGAVFTVVLPLVVASDIEEAEPTPIRQVLALAPGQPRYRLLIVDDQADNRQVLVQLLAPLGFELREADDGAQALAIWREWRPQLIWMDLRMPLLDGYEAARQIQEESPAEQQPVLLALSASSLEEERALVLAAGFADFVRKPFRAEEIFAAMSRHLGLRYVYEDSPPAVPGEQMPRSRSPEPALDPAALAALPDEILAELERGATETNPTVLNRAIAQIRGYDAALAESLAALVGAFAYGQILASIQEARGDQLQASN